MHIDPSGVFCHAPTHSAALHCAVPDPPAALRNKLESSVGALLHGGVMIRERLVDWSQSGPGGPEGLPSTPPNTIQCNFVLQGDAICNAS